MRHAGHAMHTKARGYIVKVSISQSNTNFVWSIEATSVITLKPAPFSSLALIALWALDLAEKSPGQLQTYSGGRTLSPRGTSPSPGHLGFGRTARPGDIAVGHSRSCCPGS